MAVIPSSWTNLTTRNISGKGVLRVNLSNIQKVRFLALYVDVLRYPTNRYLNNRYNPPKSRYGSLTLLRKGYVLDTIAVEYDSQFFYWELDPSEQLKQALVCATEEILQKVTQLAVPLNLFLPYTPPSIKDFKSVPLIFDEIRAVCEGDTALQLDLWSKDFYLCTDAKTERDTPDPPTKPPPPVRRPPGTPLTKPGEISPAYDGADDGSNTVPYPGDKPVEPGKGNLCQAYGIYTEVTFQDNTTEVIGATSFYAPIYNDFQIRAVGNRTSVEILCRGTLGEACQTSDVYRQCAITIKPVKSAKLLTIF